VLVDTSIWVDHLRRGNDALARRLHRGEVWVHPFVIGELGACGHLRRRAQIPSLLGALPRAPIAQHAEAIEFLESQGLFGRGLGWIVHLLASARLARIGIWTFDRRLQAAARVLDLLVDAG
jgi:predicted nucleic acid-binding protein